MTVGDRGPAPGDDDLDDRPRRRWVPIAAVVGVLVGGAVAGVLLSNPGNGGVTGPEGVQIENVPNLASAGSTMTGSPVDGITCRTSLQQRVRFHIHVHLAIFVNGQERRIPAGAGIAAPRLDEHLSTGLFVDNSVAGCLYWLHVHSNDGIIHVESPFKGTFTLGQFFDIWQQPLGPHQVGPARGTVVAFENGKRFVGNPRRIPLLPHAVIQLDVGQPAVPFQPVQFKVTGLCGAGTLTCATKVG